jgi:hypothetical protein
MANPYVDIWMRAGETAARQHQDRLLADIHHAQVEASRRIMDFWFDAWTAPLRLGDRRSRRR